MGNFNIHTKYQCCIEDSNMQEEEEQLQTPRSILEEPFKLSEKIVDKVEKVDIFQTIPVLK